ncbi:hypothetical protein [Bacillus thuringiensis]|nr:hypothetical protein [Bacillus thuringiensis]
MNVWIEEELEGFGEELEGYMRGEFLEEVGREMKFVKRKGKF